MDKKQPVDPQDETNKKATNAENKPTDADEIKSDGSGGAFSETEEVGEKETEDKPLPPDHDTPY